MFIEVNGIAYNLYSIAVVKKLDIENGKDGIDYCIEYKSNSGGTLLEKFETEQARNAKYDSIVNK